MASQLRAEGPAPAQPALSPRMSPAEITAFSAYCSGARAYAEFGCGGTTLIACQMVKRRVITLDSDPAWLRKVSDACRAAPTRLQPETVAADIGPTKEWGYPVDQLRRADWPCYHEAIWSTPGVAGADLYLVDGRFRVACLLQILLHAPSHATIMFHDYASRPYYHIIEPLVTAVSRVEELATFKRRRRFSRERAQALLQQHRFDSR